MDPDARRIEIETLGRKCRALQAEVHALRRYEEDLANQSEHLDASMLAACQKKIQQYGPEKTSPIASVSENIVVRVVSQYFDLEFTFSRNYND